MKAFVVLFSLLICLLIDVSHQKMCTESCGLHEVFSRCDAGATCQKTCFNRKNIKLLTCGCTSGCICDKGYIRCPNTYNCIPERFCGGTEHCPTNEIFSECKSGCENTCSTLGALRKCPCVSGCVCKEGYARSDISNKCIKVEKCAACPPGFKRDQVTSKCIMDCQICPDMNEQFETCGSNCTVKTCDNPTLEGKVCPARCDSGCFCRDGMLKNTLTNKCIPASQCPIKEPECIENEEPGCAIPGCEAVCNLPVSLLCKTTKQKCIKKCVCKEGSVRCDVTNKCIKIEKCPACPPGFKRDQVTLKCEPICTDMNEQFETCGSNCAVKTCDNPSLEGKACPKRCDSGCFCRDGMLKNTLTNKCIPASQCPIKEPECIENEEPGCAIPGCEAVCNLPVSLFCKTTKQKCIKKCVCKEGSVRCDVTNKCIKIEKCPACPPGFKRDQVTLKCEPICTDMNEQFETCGSNCAVKTCDNPTLEGKICPARCDSGCFCRDGMLKNTLTNKCIPASQCPIKEPECIENEEPGCAIPGCEAICNVPVSLFCKTTKQKCIKKCVCKEGSVRCDVTNKCIKIEKCPACPPGYKRDQVTLKCEPICTDMNEQFETCGSNCAVKTCDNPSLEGKICPARCDSGCFCRDGMLKNTLTNKCIPPSQCPIKKPELKCVKNEKPGCAIPGCEAACQFPVSEFCKKTKQKCNNKCVCKEGFVRYTKKDTSKCVPIKKCQKVCD